MPPSRYIRLSDEEDVRLREIEQRLPTSNPKVRLRAQVLRLSHRGYNMQAIFSAYTGRSRASIARELDRFKERGFEGLLGGKAPGNPARITQEEATEFMEGRLSEGIGLGMPPSLPRLSERTSGL